MSGITGVSPASTGGIQTNTAAAALTNAAGGALGKDQFVHLLVTEMQNQDPLNPMDGKELAVQLAQFSSVEQLINANNKLDELTQAVRGQFASAATRAGSGAANATSASSTTSGSTAAAQTA